MDKTYRSVEKIDKPNLHQMTMAYSYNDGVHYVFMDTATYEQVEISAEVLGDLHYFLVEDMECEILFHNDRAIEITLQNFIEKEIIETEPGARGDTATNVAKPAKLDNNYEVAVPIFVNQGDWIKIDTRTGKYVERVNR